MNCSLCQIAEANSRHHLVPRTKGGKETVDLCNVCHSKIHSLFTCKELEKSYDTIDKLTAHPEIAEYVVWRQKHPEFVGGFKMANSRKRKGNKYK